MVDNAIHSQADEVIRCTVCCWLAIESEKISALICPLDAIVVVEHDELISNDNSEVSFDNINDCGNVKITILTIACITWEYI